MRNEEILKKTEEGMRESNKVLIRELVRDLEEKGITPAWSIEGKIRNLRIVGESELEDFERVLKQHNLNKSDFCLLEEDTTKTLANNLSPITGSVILIHKKSAEIRTYKAGNGTNWICDFDRDLKNKIFA
jgi:hypothetical protein